MHHFVHASLCACTTCCTTCCATCCTTCCITCCNRRLQQSRMCVTLTVTHSKCMCVTLTVTPSLSHTPHQALFEKESQKRIDDLNRVFWPMISCNRWLGLRLEMCGNALISTAALAAVLARLTGNVDHHYAALLGICIYTHPHPHAHTYTHTHSHTYIHRQDSPVFFFT